MRSKLVALAAVFALLACNDGKPDERARTFRLQHIDHEQAAQLVEPYVPGGMQNIRMSKSPRAITVAGPAEDLDHVQRLLEEYDRPQPGVLLHFQVIEADGFSAVDPAIADVEKALKELFRFRGYKLLAEAVVRGSAFSGVGQTIVVSEREVYKINAGIGDIAASGSRASVHLSTELISFDRVVLSSRVTIPDGETVVLGTAKPDVGRGALILVVRPKIEQAGGPTATSANPVR